MSGLESLGSICCGGRYDTLASDGSNDLPRRGHLPRCDPHARSRSSPRSARRDPAVPSAVLVALVDEESRRPATTVAATLRRRGIPSRSRRARRSSASRSATPSGAVSRSSGSPRTGTMAAHQVKDIRSGDQVAGGPRTWTPPTRRPCDRTSNTRRSSSDPHPRRRRPPRRARRPDRDPRRLGGQPPRSRRGDLHRPPRGQRPRPGRHPRRRGRAPAAQRVLPEGHRRGHGARREEREPQPRHRRGRGRGRRRSRC